ncbi:hypothetical protein [Bartonella raoultii]|uniref:hypothetical protein n=1 Tax=Bartonella raoultii TaxID=1457020 RepID=UPI001ABBAF53|nr:hypothetical protein [Bartonella raoultii]
MTNTTVSKKYELINESHVKGITLYRIRALRDFGDVKKGDIGGFIESEYNLSHQGNCWVYDDACVVSSGRVYENAKVCGNAVIGGFVYGNAHICGKIRVYFGAHIYDNAHLSDKVWIYQYARVYGNASVGGYVKVYGSVYGNAKVTGYHTIRGLVHGNARLKRDGYSYVEQNIYYAYGIPEDCEIYENDHVVKISENKAA